MRHYDRLVTVPVYPVLSLCGTAASLCVPVLVPVASGVRTTDSDTDRGLAFLTVASVLFFVLFPLPDQPLELGHW